MEEEIECNLPESLLHLYKCMFLGKSTSYMDENRVIHTTYSYSENLNGEDRAEPERDRERLKRSDAKIYEGTLPDKLNWCDPTTLQSESPNS